MQNVTQPIELSMKEVEFLVCEVANLWRKALNNQLKSLNLTPCERRVLFTIVTKPNSTQVEVANLTDIEPQNLTRILDVLTELDYIEKKPGQHDRRVKRLHAKPEGHKIAQQVLEASDGLRPTLLADTSENEIADMAETLDKIRQNLLTYINEK